MNSLDMTKARIVDGGIASLSAATCRREGLVRRVLAASAAAYTLMAGLNVTSERARD